MKLIKIIVEKYADGYVAYPLGLKGIVVGEGDTYEEALSEEPPNVRSLGGRQGLPTMRRIAYSVFYNFLGHLGTIVSP